MLSGVDAIKENMKPVNGNENVKTKASTKMNSQELDLDFSNAVRRKTVVVDALREVGEENSIVSTVDLEVGVLFLS